MTSTLRFYEAESGDPFQPYDAVCTVIWESPSVVLIRALHGRFTVPLMRDLCRFLLDNHVQTVRAMRDGSRRLPMGEVQPDGHTLIDVAEFAERFKVAR